MRTVIGIVFSLIIVGSGIAAVVMLSSKPAPVVTAVNTPSPLPVRPEPPKTTPKPSPPAASRKSLPAEKAAAPVAPPAAVDISPLSATLKIDSDIRGAEVFIDHKYVGVTPITVPNVDLGNRRLNVHADGYEGYAEDLDVVAGPRDVFVTLNKPKAASQLDAKVDVVHKHAMGSCRGQLIATPDGLRYETTNKDDAFSAPLADVASMDLDLAAKSLKVKLKNGKTYTFTDAAGGLERLAVFQHDVIQARDRAKTGGGQQ